MKFAASFCFKNHQFFLSLVPVISFFLLALHNWPPLYFVPGSATIHVDLPIPTCGKDNGPETATFFR
jgi:hypothetical protein